MIYDHGYQVPTVAPGAEAQVLYKFPQEFQKVTKIFMSNRISAKVEIYDSAGERVLYRAFADNSPFDGWPVDWTLTTVRQYLIKITNTGASPITWMPTFGFD